MNQNRHKVTYQTTSNYHLALGGDVSIHSDVTQQFEASDALNAAEQAIRAIRESAPIRAMVINLVIVVSLKV